MKPVLGLLMLAFTVFTAFAPAYTINSSNPPEKQKGKSYQLSTAGVLPYGTKTAAIPDTCLNVFLLNQSYSTVQTTFTVQYCDSVAATYTLQPGQYIQVECVSSNFGVVVTEGEVTIDPGAWCSIKP
jgi:hypothetical protein